MSSGTGPVRRGTGVTIRDVALAAQVSAAAVSRHFNHRIILPPETVERIETAARTLGYRPNVAARRLSTGSSESLGIIVADVAYPFFSAIASAAEAESARHGYSLLIFNSRNQVENEIAFLERIRDAQVDGVLLLTNHEAPAQMAQTINAVRNVVLLDEDVPGAEVHRLFARNFDGGRIAVAHLLAQGHRRIAYVGGEPELLSTRERLRGYRAALAAAGLAADPELELFPGYGAGGGALAFERLDAMAEPPTALFVGADMLAVEMLRAMRARGVRVPQAVSMIGFDDLPLMDVIEPPLTTIRQEPEAFGRRGVQLLLGTITGEIPSVPAANCVTELVDVTLIQRLSVAPPRTDRHWRGA